MNYFWRSSNYLMTVLIALFFSTGIFVIYQFILANQNLNLLIEDPRTDTQYYNISVIPGDLFTLTYRNSVSKSVVIGTFAINKARQIEPLTTAFTSYGPGLPFDFMEDYQIKDGVITVFHDEEPRTELRLWVTPLTEETITIHNRDYPLGGLTKTHLLLNISVTR